MSTAPAFQFYPADFLSDEKVVVMSNQEVGCYIKLLSYCWKEGSIPKCMQKIARLCGETEENMNKLWPNIEGCFKENGTRYLHKRLDLEREKQRKFSQKRSAAGRIGANSRWHSHKVAKDLPLAENSSSSSSSISNNKYSQNSNEFRLSNLLLELIVKRKPDLKKPDLQKWGVHVDRMIKIDKRDPEEIGEVIKWCQGDDFWKNNILSTEKLRKQYDQLVLKMKKPDIKDVSEIEDPYFCKQCQKKKSSMKRPGLCTDCAEQGKY